MSLGRLLTPPHPSSPFPQVIAPANGSATPRKGELGPELALTSPLISQPLSWPCVTTWLCVGSPGAWEGTGAASRSFSYGDYSGHSLSPGYCLRNDHSWRGLGNMLGWQNNHKPWVALSWTTVWVRNKLWHYLGPWIVAAINISSIRVSFPLNFNWHFADLRPAGD